MMIYEDLETSPQKEVSKELIALMKATAKGYVEKEPVKLEEGSEDLKKVRRPKKSSR